MVGDAHIWRLQNRCVNTGADRLIVVAIAIIL